MLFRSAGSSWFTSVEQMGSTEHKQIKRRRGNTRSGDEPVVVMTCCSARGWHASEGSLDTQSSSFTPRELMMLDLTAMQLTYLFLTKSDDQWISL